MLGADLVSLIPPRPAWMADGACIEHPEVEFVPPGPRTEQHAYAAVALCAGCLCRAECLA